MPTPTRKNSSTTGIQALGCAIVLAVAALANVVVGGLTLRYGSEWWHTLVRKKPPGVILHHSGSRDTVDGKPVDALLIDQWHAGRGWARSDGQRVYHIGYHYVILRDGTIQQGRPETMPGAHCTGYNNHLGICLVGNFSSSANPDGRHGPMRPSSAQMEALTGLLQELAQRYGFSADNVRRHRDFAPTACPGDRFPMDEVLRRAFPDNGGG